MRLPQCRFAAARGGAGRGRVRGAAACLAFACAGPAAAAPAAFPVSFHPSAELLDAGQRAALITHVEAAGHRWSGLLRLAGPRVIEVEIALSEAIPRATGHSLVAAFVDNRAARDTYEQGAAHELRTGADQNGLQPDIRITFNPLYLRQELWFDPEPWARRAPVPATRTDAMSVLLHEFGHALAYNGWAQGNGTPPEGFWSTFDQWMLPGEPPLFDGPAVLATRAFRPDLTLDNVHHWANPVPLAAAGANPAAGLPPIRFEHGAPVPRPACQIPAPAAPPSADPQLKGDLDLRRELMNGVVFYRGTRYDLSALDRAVLIDAGLPVDPDPVFDNGFE